MILEGGFDAGNATVIEGKLDSETNPYATGRNHRKERSIHVRPEYHGGSIL